MDIDLTNLGRTLLSHDDNAHFERLSNVVGWGTADIAADGAVARLQGAFERDEPLTPISRSGGARRAAKHIWMRKNAGVTYRIVAARRDAFWFGPLIGDAR